MTHAERARRALALHFDVRPDAEEPVDVDLGAHVDGQVVTESTSPHANAVAASRLTPLSPSQHVRCRPIL